MEYVVVFPDEGLRIVFPSGRYETAEANVRHSFGFPIEIRNGKSYDRLTASGGARRGGGRPPKAPPKRRSLRDERGGIFGP